MLNTKKVNNRFKRINSVCSKQRVALWGCTNLIEDALLSGLNSKFIDFIIDNKKSIKKKQLHGIKVYDKLVLYQKEVDMVIIMEEKEKRYIMEEVRNLSVRNVFTIEQF
tara:strand:+ start:1999 stop:2325 length:327 start_codon:yes stop_codon:yes gene_type:complete